MKTVPKTHEEAASFLDHIAEADPVPCRGCTACCRGNQAVVLKEDHGDRWQDYGADNLQWENYHGVMSLTLKRQTNGDCTFLVMGACSIYAKRPAVCRQFDCRRITAMLPDKRDQTIATRKKLFAKEIFDAGRERLTTMTIQPGEEPCYDGSFANHLRTMGLL